ncbi:MAG: hypothetical protein V4563_14080 [Pseudomonadota bacterium]
MSEEIIIGPNRCIYCGGEYGDHDTECRRPKETLDLWDAVLDLHKAADRLLYWGDVECSGLQKRDLDEAKAILRKYANPLRNELAIRQKMKPGSVRQPK